MTLSLEPDVNEYVIQFKPKPALYAKGNETTRLMRELARLGTLSVQCEIADVPLLANLEPEQSYLSWRATLRSGSGPRAPCRRCLNSSTAIAISTSRRSTRGVEAAPEPRARALVEVAAPEAEGGKPVEEPKAAAPSAPRRRARGRQGGRRAPTPAQNTIRVDLDRVDRLINLVGELVINQAMLTQRVLEAGAVKNASIATGLDDLEHLTREIQESVMAIRAQPVRPLFQRMARIVREIADATGKNVRLKTEGEGAEVDRTVIERLADPLDAHDPQRRRPWPRTPRGAHRRGQAGAGRSAAVGRAQVGPRGDRDRRRRARHRPARR